MAWDIEPVWVVTAFGGMFTALSGVVAWMGAHFSGALHKCEEHHRETRLQAADRDRNNNAKMLELAQDIGALKGESAALKSVMSSEFASVVSDKIITKLNHGGVNRDNTH